MKRPNMVGTGKSAAFAALLATATAPASSVAQDQVPEALGDNWYVAEVLIFAYDQPAQGNERWEPLPVLSYPEEYRYFLDPRLLDQRADESTALQSRVDERGIQSLTVPAPVQLIDEAARVDALINTPYGSEDPNAPDPNAPFNLVGGASPSPDGPSLDETEDPNSPGAGVGQGLPVLPYALRPREDLEFAAQARTLRRRGQRVLFHGRWWAELEEGSTPLPLIIDRAADPDRSAWPELQGSIQLYRSRYLHLEVNLWLNTLGEYLPEAWQIPKAPLPEVSVMASTLDGTASDPWNPSPILDEAFFAPEQGLLDQSYPEAPIRVEEETADYADVTGGPHAEEDSTSAPESEEPVSEGIEQAWSWKHAITHRQARRMRSGEVHYLDHPVIGVLVKVQRAGAEEGLLPLETDEDAALEFRQRHGLPTEFIELPEAPAP